MLVFKHVFTENVLIKGLKHKFADHKLLDLYCYISGKVITIMVEPTFNVITIIVITIIVINFSNKELRRVIMLKR